MAEPHITPAGPLRDWIGKRVDISWPDPGDGLGGGGVQGIVTSAPDDPTATWLNLVTPSGGRAHITLQAGFVIRLLPDGMEAPAREAGNG